MQNLFVSLHSTESALLKVFNDIFLAVDSGKVVILILLDLTAAFDTADHSISLQRLEDVGVKGTALEWFKSYLIDRSFSFALEICVRYQLNYVVVCHRGLFLGLFYFHYIWALWAQFFVNIILCIIYMLMILSYISQ